MSKIYACSECGCTDIEEEWWVKANSGKPVNSCENGDIWCPQCQEITGGCCLINTETGVCEFHEKRCVELK